MTLNPHFRYYEQATAELKQAIIEAYNDIMSDRDTTEAISRRLDYAVRGTYRLLDKYANEGQPMKAAIASVVKTKVVIEMIIDGDPGDVWQALECALDNGVLQDAVNDYPDADLEVDRCVVASCEQESQGGRS